MAAEGTKMTVPRLIAMKAEGQKIVMLTAYDFTLATLLDRGGCDCLLVGDSLGNVVQGRSTTLAVTLDQIIYHAEMVGRAVKRSLVVVDLPFGTYQLGRQAALAAAVRILKETNCPAVKLEGGVEQAETVAALHAAGIPVMAHLGFRPQSVHRFGGFKVDRDRQQLLADAKAVSQAGAFGIVLECIPPDVAAEITAAAPIPTIGIGAGAGCDGQVLVTHDLLGLTVGRVPRFAKRYADLGAEIAAAVGQYRDEVRASAFPSSDYTYS